MTPWCGREPRRWQREALDAVLGAMRGGTRRPLVQATTGAGKSLFLAELAARCKGRVLVTTPSQQLVAQLSATLEERCPDEVGRAYQHAWEPDRRIVVTCNASLERLLDEQPEWACWIADEAHRMEGERLRAVQARIVRKVACGLTATPFRADRRGMENWDRLVYEYPSARAVEDGVLVPWRAVRWDGVGTPTTDELVERWVATAEGPGIVSATSVADAEAFAARLGPTALAIHDRLGKRERQRRLDALRDGEIRCLVHVSLLTEGVDLPWLRWLAMRRPVGSVVRLVQEVGRVLRAYDGKTEAVLFDPYNLLGEIGLTHAASLEDALGSEAAEQEREDWSIEELSGLDGVCTLPPPKAVEVLEGWVSDVVESLRSYHLLQTPRVPPGPWRRQPASQKQREALEKMARYWGRFFPYEPHRRAVRWLVKRPELHRGTASDMFDVLSAFAEAVKTEGYRWKCPVAIPTITVPEWAA